MDFAAPFRIALSPLKGFKASAQSSESLGHAFLRMLAWRTMLGWLNGALFLWGFTLGYQAFRTMRGPLWTLVMKVVNHSPAEVALSDIREMLFQLPVLPPLSQLLLWMLPLVPIGVASGWLHNVAWDHGCLWLLGGVDRTRGWRTTMRAESTAMWVGSVGVLLGLLSYLPLIGFLLGPLLGAVGIYFWILRGVALATFHGCPLWKGITATILHGLLAFCCGCGALLLTWLWVQALVGGLGHA